MPAHVQRLTWQAKDGLGRAIEAALQSCAHDVPCQERRIAERLPAAALVDVDRGQYGFVTRVKLVKPEGLPSHRVVIAALSLPCGEDAVSWLFELRSGRWIPILVDSEETMATFRALLLFVAHPPVPRAATRRIPECACRVAGRERCLSRALRDGGSM